MRSILLFAGALAAIAPSALAGQPRESVQQNARLCSYPGPITGTARTVQISIGQNCPATYPGDLSTTYPVPPTARLRDEQVVGESRLCAYEQSGTTWRRTIPIGQNCPLSAGLLPPELRNPRS